LLVAAVFCSATLHVPRNLAPAPQGVATVSITAGDRAKLSAWWLRAAKPNGNCVLVLHGISDSRNGTIGYAPMFRNRGIPS
jgi:hypothetical protein